MNNYQQKIRDIIFLAVEREIPIYEAASDIEALLRGEIDGLEQGMTECCACGSGTYDPIIAHSPTGKCESYCGRCHPVFVKPVDN